jgi:hypothetical protein
MHKVEGVSRDEMDNLVPAFAHLIGSSHGGHEIATCLYFDDLTTDVSVDVVLDLAEHWFSRCESKPRVVMVKEASGKRLPRPSIKTLRQLASGRMASDVFETFEVFPKGRTTIEDTWRPTVYFAVCGRRPTAAFMTVNSSLERSATLGLLQNGDMILGAAASYAFSFPVRFSPLGYFWGISVQPAGRDVGEWGKLQSRRLSHWRDNTRIGIDSGNGRRWYAPRDGYVRDAYPLMLLSPKHVTRAAGAVSLGEAIERRGIGSIAAARDNWLWSIPSEKLSEAQNLLDESEISLSGRRIERSGPRLQ